MFYTAREQPYSEEYHARSSLTTTPAALCALVLILYPNAMAVVSHRRHWDQWHAFTLGNTLLGGALLVLTLASGLRPDVWGRMSWGGLATGALAGSVPLLIILALMFLPGQLGRDIVASGIGAIGRGRFLYRVTIQVAITTVLFEEFAFRGLLQALLLQALPSGRAVAYGAVVFGLWHTGLQYYSFASQRGLTRLGATLGGTLVYGLLGVLLALVRLRTGSLAAAIVAHGVLDVFMFVGMAVRRAGLRPAPTN